MDWKRVIEEERAALGRIVALLCALAALAERAAGCSPAVRGFVLWLLRHAEAVARDFVAGDPDAPPVSMPIVPAGNLPQDAIRLAVSLRALALRLDEQARLLAVRGQDSGETEPLPPGRMPAIRVVRDALSSLLAFAGREPHLTPAPDTS